jgi:hypothetical protein
MGEHLMSTRQTWAHELAGRARRVGWDVEQIDGGVYKVRCPDRFIVQLHLTSSDRNAHKTAERALNAHGFAEAEEKQARKEARQKAARLAADRKAADTKARKAVAQTTAIARAAGPYAVLEEVEPAWFLTPHPSPWVRWCMITPELAQTLLDKLNTHNRPILQVDVDKYIRILISGQWASSHQGMAIDSDGVLQDGQHRLKAIAESNIPAPVFMFVGMPPDNFKAIDEGRLRNAAQLLARDGEKSTTTVGATIRLIGTYSSPDPRRQAKFKPTNMEIYDVFATHADQIRDVVFWARSQPFRKIGIPPSVLAAARYLLHRSNGEGNPYVEAFFTGLITGTKTGTRILLDDDDPRSAVRGWFINRKEGGLRTDALDQLAILVKAWNYLIDDRRSKYLRQTKDQAIPYIGVCRPDGDNASAPPPLIADEMVNVVFPAEQVPG